MVADWCCRRKTFLWAYYSQLEIVDCQPCWPGFDIKVTADCLAQKNGPTTQPCLPSWSPWLLMFRPKDQRRHQRTCLRTTCQDNVYTHSTTAFAALLTGRGSTWTHPVKSQHPSCPFAKFAEGDSAATTALLQATCKHNNLTPSWWSEPTTHFITPLGKPSVLPWRAHSSSTADSIHHQACHRKAWRCCQQPLAVCYLIWCSQHDVSTPICRRMFLIYLAEPHHQINAQVPAEP